MTRLLFIICCLFNSIAAANSDIAGVWFPADQKISCACGHRFHLKISPTATDKVFDLTEYCIGHKQATPLGDMVLSEDSVRLMSVGIKLKFKLSEDKATLTLIGENHTGANPLILTRENLKKFRGKLSQISAAELSLSRVSFLLGSSDPVTPDSSNPFIENEGKPDAEQDGESDG